MFKLKVVAPDAIMPSNTMIVGVLVIDDIDYEMLFNNQERFELSPKAVNDLGTLTTVNLKLASEKTVKEIYDSLSEEQRIEMLDLIIPSGPTREKGE